MKKRLLVLPFLCAASACASITLSSGPAEDRAGKIGGIRLTLNDAGFTRKFTGEDHGIPDTVRLDTVTLVSRDHLRNFIGNPTPLYLKIYESTARDKPVAGSRNALRWDMGGAIPQTYFFDAVKLDPAKSYFLIFETAPGPKSPIGAVGLSVTKGTRPEAAEVLGEEHLHDVAGLGGKPIDAVITLGLSGVGAPEISGATVSAGVPAVTPVTVAPADTTPAPVAAPETPPAAVPAMTGPIISGLFGVLAAAAMVFVIVRRRRRAAGPVLPPPPGRD